MASGCSPNTKKAQSMAPRANIKRSFPPLKHGAYAKMDVLPGERLADFEKLHQEVIDDLQPSGPLENDIVLTITRLLWRKQRIEILNVARKLAVRRDEIIEQEYRRRDIDVHGSRFRTEIYDGEEADNAAREEAEAAGEQKAKHELGEQYLLIDNTDATIEGVLERLAVAERLDEMVARNLKRYILMKGIKSVIDAPSAQRPKIPKPNDANQ
jgi:hypothetical protein